MRAILKKYSKEIFALIAILAIYFAYSYTKPLDIANKLNDSIPTIGDGTEIVRGDTTKQQVIFTFDGGSDAQSAEKVLEVLQRHNVKGTFFLAGTFIDKHKTIVSTIVNRQHEIFNHTDNHLYLPKLSDQEIVDELVSANEKMMLNFRKSMKPYFRAPYGERDMRVLGIAKEAGYRSVFWTIDAEDWRESEGMTDSQVMDKILTNLAPGTIYLLHLGDGITGRILDDVLSAIKLKGYKIVSLTEGL